MYIRSSCGEQTLLERAENKLPPSLVDLKSTYEIALNTERDVDINKMINEVFFG